MQSDQRRQQLAVGSSADRELQCKVNLYLCKEHRFVHVSATQSHGSPEGLKDTPGHIFKMHLNWECETKTPVGVKQHTTFTLGVSGLQTCELMCPAACISATSAELLTALRE